MNKQLKKFKKSFVEVSMVILLQNKETFADWKTWRHVCDKLKRLEVRSLVIWMYWGWLGYAFFFFTLVDYFFGEYELDIKKGWG